MAISAAAFDPHSPMTGGLRNPNANEFCGKSIQITLPATGASTDAVIVDRKASGSADAIDVSPGVFTALGLDQAAGSAQISWTEPA